MHRELALRINTDMASNWRIIQPIRVALQVATRCLTLRKVLFKDKMSQTASRTAG
jgi:hypothetical protein